MYVRNVGNIAHILTAQQHKYRIIINEALYVSVSFRFSYSIK
jgi:hypothetical protein